MGGDRAADEVAGSVPVRVHPIAELAGGAFYARRGDRAVIVVAPSLAPAERTYAVAHERAHHDFGVLQPPATDATMERVEQIVHTQAASTIVPLSALADWVDREPEGVTAASAAEHFGTTVAVAETMLGQLQAQRNEDELRRLARPGRRRRATSRSDP